MVHRKTAYMIDRFGAYCGAREWPIDPLESRNLTGFVVHRRNPNYIETPPPETEEGEVAVWVRAEQRWITAPDHRGELWLTDTGDPVIVASPGDPEALGYSRPPEPEPEPEPTADPTTEAERRVIDAALRTVTVAALDTLLLSGRISRAAHTARMPKEGGGA